MIRHKYARGAFRLRRNAVLPFLQRTARAQRPGAREVADLLGVVVGTAEAALGLVVGGNYRRTQEVRDLVRAWSLRAGGGLREREDCVSA